MYRNPKLTKLARGQPCMVRSPVCNQNPETTVWAHSNFQRHGKGTGLKAHDCFGFFACSDCHYMIDNDGRVSNAAKEWLVQTAMERTWLYLWQHEFIKVSSQ